MKSNCFNIEEEKPKMTNVVLGDVVVIPSLPHVQSFVV
jgi:hypothetical protein